MLGSQLERLIGKFHSYLQHISLKIRKPEEEKVDSFF